MDRKSFEVGIERLLGESMSDGFNFDIKHTEWTDDGVLAVITKDDTQFQIVITRIVCAWCPTFNPTDEQNRGATHGMCPTCKAKLEASL